jgi:phosphocarrier protein
MSGVTRIVTIQNKKGLHARAAAKFVKTVTRFKASVKVTRLGEKPEALADESLDWTVGGASILGLMMLGAEPGVELQLDAMGTEANEVLDAWEHLIIDRFDVGE